jgi:hypothetical protein
MDKPKAWYGYPIRNLGNCTIAGGPSGPNHEVKELFSPSMTSQPNSAPSLQQIRSTMALLDLPKPAGSTVGVSVIVGGHITVQTRFMVKEQVSGHSSICAPSYSFPIENKGKG